MAASWMTLLMVTMAASVAQAAVFVPVAVKPVKVIAVASGVPGEVQVLKKSHVHNGVHVLSPLDGRQQSHVRSKVIVKVKPTAHVYKTARVLSPIQVHAPVGVHPATHVHAKVKVRPVVHVHKPLRVQGTNRMLMPHHMGHHYPHMHGGMINVGRGPMHPGIMRLGHGYMHAPMHSHMHPRVPMMG